MDYKDILQRYYEGCTTLAEEQALRNYLITADIDTLSAEEKATRLMMQHASQPHKAEVSIKMKTAKSYRLQIIGAMAACVIILLGAIKLLQPTVYGYHNGRPITSLEEAEYLGRQMFDELAIADNSLQNENLLKDMFRFE